MTILESEVFETKVAVNNLHRTMAIGFANVIAVMCGLAILFVVLKGVDLVENVNLQLMIIGSLTVSAVCGWLESDSIVTGKTSHPIRVTCVFGIIFAVVLIILGVI
jgi:hypothetical protein